MRRYRSIVAAIALLFASAAFAGDHQKGLDAFNSADYETALAEWRPLAEAGNAEAQFGLGMMYGNGFGVMMDDALAIKWYGLAAEQGHGQAIANLAVMHQNGWGVPQDESEALRLFGLAAEAGVAEAMVALGRYYSLDFSDDYDPVAAYQWFSLAALLEDYNAAGMRESLAVQMSAEEVAEGNARVEAWTSKNEAMLARSQ